MIVLESFSVLFFFFDFFLDANSLTIKVYDPWVDTDNPQNFYKKVTDFRQKGVKVSVAIGGWNDSQGSKYGRILTDATARKKFINSVVDFIKKYNFQGLDLDLEVSFVCLSVKLLNLYHLFYSIVSHMLARKLQTRRCTTENWICSISSGIVTSIQITWLVVVGCCVSKQ